MGLISVDGYEPKHLSYSTISSYRMCGKKFQLTKVMQLEEKPGLAAIGGNALHTASERVDEFIQEHGFEALAVDVGENPIVDSSAALPEQHGTEVSDTATLDTNNATSTEE